MFRVATVVVLLGLSGCTTVSGVQAKAASFTAETSRSAAAVEECVALNLSKYGAPSIIRGEGRTILSYGNPNPAFTITIADQGSSRLVEGRKGIVAPSRQDVERCL